MRGQSATPKRDHNGTRRSVGPEATRFLAIDQRWSRPSRSTHLKQYFRPQRTKGRGDTAAELHRVGMQCNAMQCKRSLHSTEAPRGIYFNALARVHARKSVAFGRGIQRKTRMHTHSANYCVACPGNTPANQPPTEAYMMHSKQHRGCRVQDPGTHGYRRWKTADFSHSARRAHGALPLVIAQPDWNCIEVQGRP